MTLNEAINTIKNDKPENQEGIFITKRDLIFLEEAKNILEKE
jgi:hypothetical protein